MSPEKFEDAVRTGECKRCDRARLELDQDSRNSSSRNSATVSAGRKKPRLI